MSKPTTNSMKVLVGENPVATSSYCGSVEVPTHEGEPCGQTEFRLPKARGFVDKVDRPNGKFWLGKSEVAIKTKEFPEWIQNGVCLEIDFGAMTISRLD